jgi:hypothetical protein
LRVSRSSTDWTACCAAPSWTNSGKASTSSGSISEASPSTNFFVGYLLVHRDEQSASGLALFGFALGVHFIVNDQAFRQEHGEDLRQKRALAARGHAAGGLVGGVITEIDPLWLSALFAFLAGSIVLNV